MYWIAKEVMKGNCHDQANAFQWDHLELNLPGTKDYTPSRAWITKRWRDGLLASDVICFVDDQRVTGQGGERLMEAGHTISTRESYLGLQDALRKVRAPCGSKHPGAWAGTNVCIEEELRVVILTSQEKWDQLNSICSFWLEIINQGV